MNRLWIIAAALAIPAPAFGQTQVLDGLRFCAEFKDGGERLECFDKFTEGVLRIFDGMQQAVPQAAPATPGAPADAIHTTAVDLTVDFDQLLGKTVVVTGKVMMFGQRAMLSDDGAPGNNVFVNIDNLPRDQRRDVIAKCSSIMACTAEVVGTVAKVDWSEGIEATSVRVISTR